MFKSKESPKSVEQAEAPQRSSSSPKPLKVPTDRKKRRQMAQHLHYMKVLSSRNLDYAKNEIARNQRRSNKKYNVDDLREMSYTLPTGYTFTIFRIYISTADSKGLKDVGWVINDRNSFCLLCFKDFGVRRWKHHCRACGNLVCKECSDYECPITSMEEYGPAKVCQSCYKPVRFCFLWFEFSNFHFDFLLPILTLRTHPQPCSTATTTVSP
jgi:hypothetical protein